MSKRFQMEKLEERIAPLLNVSQHNTSTTTVDSTSTSIPAQTIDGHSATIQGTGSIDAGPVHNDGANDSTVGTDPVTVPAQTVTTPSATVSASLDAEVHV